MSGPGRGAGPHPKRPRSTARDIERYAALFAERTKVMKSSAMRDLMAGRVFVAIDGDHLNAKTLQRDDHFLA